MKGWLCNTKQGVDLFLIVVNQKEEFMADQSLLLFLFSLALLALHHDQYKLIIGGD